MAKGHVCPNNVSLIYLFTAHAEHTRKAISDFKKRLIFYGLNVFDPVFWYKLRYIVGFGIGRDRHPDQSEAYDNIW